MTTINPTYVAMAVRRQHSDAHLFVASDLHSHCDRCGRRRSHSDHVTPEGDRAEVQRWKDRVG